MASRTASCRRAARRTAQQQRKLRLQRRPCRFENRPFLLRQAAGGSRIIYGAILALVGGKAAVEILDIAEELRRLGLVGASAGDEVRQLAELHVFEAQLAP